MENVIFNNTKIMLDITHGFTIAASRPTWQPVPSLGFSKTSLGKGKKNLVLKISLDLVGQV